MSQAPIRAERRDDILIVTIDRPHVRNAIDGPTARALTDAIDAFEADPSLSIGILTGAGGHFCAGADLKAAAANGNSGSRTERGAMGMCQHPPAKVMIAAIEGAAAGGGFELALACHMIVAAEDARMGLPEVRRNLVANGGGLLRLPRRIPPNIATEVALSGDLYPAGFFHRWGLVNRLTPGGGALEEALALARSLARNGPTAIDATAAILTATPDWTLEQGWEGQAALSLVALESDDRIEGARAFVEKRPPVWKGRS